MTQNVFATRSLEPRDQYEAWREHFQPIIEVMPGQQADSGFAAVNEIWRLGELAVSRVAAPSVRVARTKAGLRRDPVDHWVLSYCRSGTTSLRTETSALQARPGVPYLWSLGEPSDSQRTAVERLQIFLPRDAFRTVAPQFDQARGAVLDTPLGHLLGDYMLALERRLPTIGADELPRLTTAVRGMLVACIAPSAERLVIASRQIDLGRLERVRQAVRQHLRSPALTPKTLSRLVGISRSNLYRLLEEAGGVAQYIQRQRLLEAHAVLCGPALGKSISTLAEQLCFADASSFSRAFRHEFAQSPSEVRAAAVAGLAPASLRAERAASEAASFADFLR